MDVIGNIDMGYTPMKYFSGGLLRRSSTEDFLFTVDICQHDIKL